MITEQMVKEGRENGTIKLVTDPLFDYGTVCQIGEHWFYFDGSAAEIKGPEEYVSIVLEEEIQKDIYNTLEEFRETEDVFDTEYAYYEAYLKEHTGAPKQVLLFTASIPKAIRKIFSEEELEALTSDPKKRLDPEIHRKIREAAVPIPDKDAAVACKKQKDTLFMPDGFNGNAFCGWAGHNIGNVYLIALRKDTLWTIRNTGDSEELLYFARPDGNGYLRPVTGEEELS